MIGQVISALGEALRPFREMGPFVRKLLIGFLRAAWGAFCTALLSSLALYAVAAVFFRPVPGGLEGHRKLFISLLTGGFTGVCAAILIAVAVFFIVAAYCFVTYVVGAFRQNFGPEKKRLSDLRQKLPLPLEPFCPETEAIHSLERKMKTDTFFNRVLYRFSIDDRLIRMEIDFALSTLECQLARRYLNTFVADR